MEEIKEQLQNNLQKIKLLENFIALSLRRQKIEPKVNQLWNEAEQVRQLVEQANEMMTKELDQLQVQYDKLIEHMHQQQTTIMDHVIKERQRKLTEAEGQIKQEKSIMLTGGKLCKSVPNSVLKSGTKTLAQNLAQMHLNKGATTPKMTIYDYKESPLVRRVRINPIPISFLEFAYNITPQQFNSIPKYMRGRETLDELNGFLDSTIIACFNEKYQLLHRQRNTLRHPSDMEIWNVYQEQEKLVPGRYFITPGDISRCIKKMIDKKMQNRITMLRHIGVLQERRVSQTICYIWLSKADDIL